MYSLAQCLTLAEQTDSVKWVGMFVTAMVGLYTIIDLWDKLGDLKMPYVSAHSKMMPRLIDN